MRILSTPATQTVPGDGLARSIGKELNNGRTMAEFRIPRKSVKIAVCDMKVSSGSSVQWLIGKEHYALKHHHEHFSPHAWISVAEITQV
jgi:hypothetical protein